MTDGLYIGRSLDDESPALLDGDHLTTHAVCLGMTGSGKTGLGVVAIEELARRGVPALILDLKGDMANLLLNFPDLRGEDFAPWLPPSIAEEGPRDEIAARQAATWRKGLAGAGLDGDDMRAVRDSVRWQLLTPGVASGAPVDILPSLSPPPDWDPERDPDAARERIGGLTSALLSLIGRGGDPLSDPDHVLVANVILERWRTGRPLDLPGLLAALVDPPMTTLGALPLDVVYPRNKRLELVMALNTLVASPAFAAWTTGTPVSMDSLLGPPGDPRATIVALSHLDDRQRAFFLALLFTEVVAWMRNQPASGSLRALIYLDEVQGLLPPHPANPPTKAPILTLLKQGRAFGLGLWLATQNPVDLDYKALGNAGVKLIGRLITERDRERALEGLGVAGTDEAKAVDQRVGALGKREFVLLDVRGDRHIRSFSSRWAMSYLRGPVTLTELAPLLAVAGPPTTEAVRVETPSPAPEEPPADAPPILPVEIEQRFGGLGGLLEPSLFLRNRLTIERKSLSLLRTLDELWMIPIDADGEIQWDGAERLEVEPEFGESPPPGARFPDAAPPGLAADLRTADREFVRWRARRPVMVLTNPELDCAAEPGEDRTTFADRCLELADRADDKRQESVRHRYERKVESLRKRLQREQDELDRDRDQAASRRAEERLGMVEGLFSVLLGSRSVRTAAGKATTKLRSVSSKRRMRQSAEASVIESEHEIERLEREIEDLAAEMEAEVESIAEASEVAAAKIEETPIKATQSNVVVRESFLVWS